MVGFVYYRNIIVYESKFTSLFKICIQAKIIFFKEASSTGFQ